MITPEDIKKLDGLKKSVEEYRHADYWDVERVRWLVSFSEKLRVYAEKLKKDREGRDRIIARLLGKQVSDLDLPYCEDDDL